VKMNKVLYDASVGYDADVWDTALIKAYDKAKESSRRELMRTRQEKKKGSGGMKRSWELGEACRAVYSEDMEEYEGTIVNKNIANRSVTVRFHGYNNEEEIYTVDLMESLGSDAVKEQLEQAELDDLEEEEEEEGAGEEFGVGDWCRAEWSEDGVVYEAVIESVNRRKETAIVRFLGFNNREEKQLNELYLSKGEERREQQENLGTEDDIKEDEIHNLIVKNCPDLLANFGEVDADGVEDLDLDSLTIEPKTKQKTKKKSSNKSKPSKIKKEPAEEQIEEEPKKKGNKLKKEKNAKNTYPKQPSVPNSLPSWDWQTEYQPHFPGPMASPMFPQFPHMAAPMFPAQMPAHPLPSMHLPMPPSGIPPPPVLDGMMEDDKGLHSLLLSWYMAGYQAGLYQQAQGSKATKTQHGRKADRR